MSTKKNNTTNNTKEHEPVIEVEEMGVMEVPAGMPVPQPQKPKMVKDVLIEDINFLRGMSFTTDEVEKFGLVIAKVKQDLIACVDGIEREEQRLAAMKKEEEHAAAGAE